MKQRPCPAPPGHRSPSFASLPARHRARGMALVEALVASAVLGIGLAGATRLTWHALQTATDTRQHTVAQALGVNAMECLQSGLSPCEMTQEVTVQGTRYSLQSQVRQRADLALLDLEVRVQWTAVGRAPASGQSGVSPPAGGTAQQTGQLVLHSSRDEVPSWLGVSLP